LAAVKIYFHRQLPITSFIISHLYALLSSKSPQIQAHACYLIRSYRNFPKLLKSEIFQRITNLFKGPLVCKQVALLAVKDLVGNFKIDPVVAQFLEQHLFEDILPAISNTKDNPKVLVELLKSFQSLLISLPRGEDGALVYAEKVGITLLDLFMKYKGHLAHCKEILNCFHKICGSRVVSKLLKTKLFPILRDTDDLLPVETELSSLMEEMSELSNNQGMPFPPVMWDILIKLLKLRKDDEDWEPSWSLVIVMKQFVKQDFNTFILKKEVVELFCQHITDKLLQFLDHYESGLGLVSVILPMARYKRNATNIVYTRKRGSAGYQTEVVTPQELENIQYIEDHLIADTMVSMMMNYKHAEMFSNVRQAFFKCFFFAPIKCATVASSMENERKWKKMEPKLLKFLNKPNLEGYRRIVESAGLASMLSVSNILKFSDDNEKRIFERLIDSVKHLQVFWKVIDGKQLDPQEIEWNTSDPELITLCPPSQGFFFFDELLHFAECLTSEHCSFEAMKGSLGKKAFGFTE